MNYLYYLGWETKEGQERGQAKGPRDPGDEYQEHSCDSTAHAAHVVCCSLYLGDQ